MDGLTDYRSVFADEPTVASGISSLVLELITPLAHELGWEVRPNEGHLTGMLRALLVGLAGRLGDQSTLAEAKRLPSLNVC
jgi:aminopeptidase 2